MRNTALAVVGAAFGAGLCLAACPARAAYVCPGNNGGLDLSPGWCATIFADNLGHVRHMAFAPNGVLYVNSVTHHLLYRDRTVPAKGFLIALKDSKGTGHADIVERFGESAAQGSTGGTGIYYFDHAIYAEENDKIIRFPLTDGDVAPKRKFEVVVSGLPITGDHPMHPFIIGKNGDMFIDIGSATNSCQVRNRIARSPGERPCGELETRGGIWRYRADVLGQRFSPAGRYVTGLRNGEGFGFDADGRLFATQHGRDQLWLNWPNLYTATEGAEQPAEELVRLAKGADFGWPYCYFDGLQKKLVLAPEYGGDGGKAQGVCCTKTGPIAFFPAHSAPNDMLIDNDPSLPAAYRGGAFIAFHGSWDAAPKRQTGYDVIFQPLKDGKAAGKFIVFANGFAGRYREPGLADYRPTGLAASPAGAIYISDDVHGRIWRLTYHGAADAPIAPAPRKMRVGSADHGAPPAPEALPLPPGASRAQLVLGDRVFHGEAADGTCAGCHGSDAKGSPQGPDLTILTKTWSDGSLEGLEKTIANGVPKPRDYLGPMPPKGGAPLTEADVKAVAAYVWGLSHQNRRGAQD